ncbi:uncharacterized protein LOC125037085 isoform X1 [Penaeus chinensis]|uniref:uncharacterized protein LOC125037085 isoform X1 n=1 Tax=Penaeus chinensis TaxID=139456 RepID=UPI001FB79C53|nr:uncharacterized protein LOC125037085 isoform X1 [Penaeus chinensis]
MKLPSFTVIFFSETEDNADIDETNEGSSLLQQVVAKRLQFEDGMFDHSPIDEDAESLLADHPNDTTTFESVIKSDPAAEGLDSCSSDVSSVRNYESSSFGSEFSLKQEGSELKTELDCDDEEKPLGKLQFYEISSVFTISLSSNLLFQPTVICCFVDVVSNQ